ncbi:MAG: wax ester/triacylglycerol synthase family O-acyltransferase [Acidimicrobiales bacterium]|nr:wax ester/triacylglycerol synthase family O-acyltransferase [Acidimicrobiales bacterium]
MADRFEVHMSDSDALMWNMEKDPMLRGTITAVMVLDRAPDWERFRSRMDLASRLVLRLRQRVMMPPLRLGLPRYAVDPDFDLAYHVRRVSAPPPGDLDAVLELAQAWGMSGLDRARPLWEFTLVEGMADGGAALVMKVHHSVIDGVGGIELALRMLDAERMPAEPPSAPPVPEGEPIGPADLVRDALGMAIGDAAGTARRLPGVLGRLAVRALRDPIGTTAEAVRMGRSVVKLLAPATTMLSPVMRERSARWRYDVFDVPLDELKLAGKAAGGSLNDAFIAAVCGGLRRYHERHGTSVDELRMTMPVSLRDEGDPLGGNRISPLRMRMPVGEADPRRRIELIGEISRTWRAEPAVEATPAIAGVLNRLPTTAMTALFGGMLKHVDFLTSNVPGIPGATVYLAGSRVRRWYALGPTEGAATNVTLLSHGDLCCMGVTSDAAAIPDGAVLTACMREGFDEVLALVTGPGG